MAEENSSSAGAPDTATILTRSGARRALTPKQKRIAALRRGIASVRLPRMQRPKHPVRSTIVLTMVAGLFATAAIPAYAASQSDETQTLQQVAADNAQSLVVASETTDVVLDRASYSATTPEEIQTKKAAEAAAAAAARSSSFSLASVDLTMVAPGSGQVRWPLDMSQIRIGRGLGDSGYHQGVDLLGAAGTPEFAAAAGTVRSAGWSGGYGNMVDIDHVINGQRVTTRYGHMIQQPSVSVGQKVEAGQIIGLMGSTGSSTANHLHFEVRINGTIVDPLAWLRSNAG